MARVTVEDCVLRIPNRFELVMLAAQRARDISAGSPLTVDRDKDKNPVVALREIAEETVALEQLAEELVLGMQKHVEADTPEDEVEFLDADALSLQIEEADGTEGRRVGASASEDDVDDLDLESLARELAQQAGEFRDREED